MAEQDFTQLQGWAGRRVADKAWETIGSELPKFFIAGQVASTEGKTLRAWDLSRKVLAGKDMKRTIQQAPDCVGMSTIDMAMYKQLADIAMGQRKIFKPLLCSYVYATSRVLIGNNQLKGSGGSVGSWMAKAIQKYGFLADDFADSPEYSGKLSDYWGDDKLYNNVSFRKFIDEGDNHLGVPGARITSWTQLRDGIINAHFGTIASNRGYAMKPDSEGYHRPSGSWSHQMSILALCDDPKNSWVALGNQWGDVHGLLKDFQTGEEWPRGMLRVKRDDFERKHLTNGAECFLYPSIDGFQDNSEDLEGMLF